MELKGKKINFLGDSITEGSCASRPEWCYVEVMKQKYALAEARNYGIGGTRIARQHTPSAVAKYDRDFCSRVEEMDADADIVVVFGGTNDHGHGDAPLGIGTDRTPDTFCGACHCLYALLKARFPQAVIVVLTPLHRSDESPKGQEGWILKDYVNVIRKIAPQYQLPVLDLYDTSAIHTDSLPTLTADGLHPNDTGHAILADEIGEYLKAL